MRKAGDWLREERRKTLGDWAAFCPDCGHGMRYFDEFEEQLPSTCPECGGQMRHRCPACNARFTSIFAVECEECSEALRPATKFGGPIRRPGRD